MSKEKFSKQIPNLMIPIDVVRTEGFRQWPSQEMRLHFFLMSYIVRSPKMNPGNLHIYEEYYLNGKLCASWSTNELAKAMGLNSASHMSKIITDMERKKLFKKHVNSIGGSVHRPPLARNVFELGNHDHNGNEIYYAFSLFRQNQGEKNLGIILKKNM